MLIKIDILLSHVNVNKMSMGTCLSEQKNTWIFFLNKPKKTTTTFFNPKTETNPDRKPTFEQKNDPDPDRYQKVNPAGLYCEPSYLHTN
jgi:hypothetical protein